MFRDNNRKRTRGIRNSKNRSEKITNPVIMPNTLSINGSVFDKTYSFSCGNIVPIYEVNTVHALNQLIGYAKFNNQSYGNVYYRGECKLHPSIKPSLFRSGKKINNAQERINKLINKIAADQYMRRELNLILVIKIILKTKLKACYSIMEYLLVLSMWWTITGLLFGWD